MSITSHRSAKGIESLREMGFSDLEATLYFTLLRDGAQSAYSAARSVGQSPSNIYRLLESLTRKGAIISEGGASKIVRAVPIDELIATLRGTFDRHAEVVQRELHDLSAEAPDPGTYRLERADQVFARCRQMLAQANTIALIDAFPGALARIRKDVEELTKRRVRTLLKIYEPVEVVATRAVLTPAHKFVLGKWPGQWLNLVVDGREALIAYLDSEMAHVHQAVCTSSRYVAWTYHSALAAEISLTAIHNAAQGDPAMPAADLLAGVRENMFGKTRANADLINGIFPLVARKAAMALFLAMFVVAGASHAVQAQVLPRHGLLGAAVDEKNAKVDVARVVPGSAAQAAGIQPRDFIDAVDGTPVRTVAEFLAKVRRPAGQPVTIELQRNGARFDKTVVMRAPPDEEDPDVVTHYDAVTIDGTLRRTLVTMPVHTAGRLPAVFLIGGIGCFSVDTADAQDAYRNVAHDLSRNGFAVLRLEKSGVGDSQGPPCASVDFNTEYHSYEVALREFLKNPAIDPDHVYIFGHSIGTIVAPRLALTNRVAGLIVADGVGVNWFEYELLNLQRQEVLSGKSPAAVDDAVAAKEYCMHRLLIEKAAFAKIIADRPSCADYITYPAPPAYMQQVAALNIAEPWTKVSVPVLAVYGGADFVTALSDHEHIVDIVNKYHPGHATIEVVPNMNHDLYVAASPEEFMRQFTQGTPMVYNKRFSTDMVAWLCRSEHCPSVSRAATVTLPLNTWDNRIMVPVTLNGRGPFSFILDTGDGGGVVITPETARALELRTSAGAQQSGVGERTVGSSVSRVDSLAIGALQFRDQRVTVLNLNQIRAGLRFPHLDGIIGYTILRGLNLRVDPDRRSLTLSRTNLPVPKNAHVVSFALRDNLIHVPAMIAATAGTLVLDTGDRSSLTLFGGFSRAHRIYGKYPSLHNVLTGYGIGGPVYGDVFRLPSISMFGFRVTGVVTRASRQHAGAFATAVEAGSVGGNLLKRFNMVYDYPRRHLAVWPSRLFDTRDVFDPPR